MIRYALRCNRGHGFESWFQDSASFDKQVARKLVNCPTCNSVKVEKSIMAPQIPRKGRSSEQRAAEEKAQRSRSRRKAPLPQNTVLPAKSAHPLMMMAQDPMVRTQLKAFREHIKANAADVGANFAEEARKMHYGEAEQRPIYGEASPSQARELIEEGVEVLALPTLPEDQN